MKGLVTTMTKMTNSIALANAIATLKAINGYDAEVIGKLENIKASIDKKNATKSDKPTAKQTENVGFKADIVDFLSDGHKATITDLIKGIDSLAELSNQRVSAIVRQLKEDNVLDREEIKRKAYFFLKVED